MVRFGFAFLLILLTPIQSTSSASSPNAVDLYVASLRTFSILRSGISISDSITGIGHPPSHVNDATLAGSSEHRDLSGGWYNAGDFGKWTMMAAISVSYMLHLYSFQQEHGKADPRLLDEAKWGLTWLLKMQDPDGGVRHKIDGGTDASLARAWGLSPDLDPNLRIATAASTLDTADFAAVMYQASRSFKPLDRSMSRRLQKAADHAYAWLLKHPNTPASDPFYADDDPAQEILWARCERAVSSGKSSGNLSQELAVIAPAEVSWSNPSLLGVYSLAASRSSPKFLHKEAFEAILRAATLQTKDAAHRRFRVALGDSEYRWGSAEWVLHRGSLFIMADMLQPSPLFHRAAVDQLNWVLGNNALQHSFITGFGNNPVQHPYHWTYMALGKVMPGWTVGGPNASPAGADKPLIRLQQQGTAPEKCYLDLCSREGSWASNEGQISEEAALVFLTGSLVLRSDPHR